ncbi:MAG: efflux RND transporter periplasmic adaptor subunit [Bacteroidales bacterium]|nr:efflux RND transporter periplasmic adaptor subunit [Bacteroidales bacterium]
MDKKKNYNLIIGVIALVAIILLIALVGYFVSKPRPTLIQGETEGSEYRVSGKVPGRIEELYYKEGQTVHKGDTVARIDSPEVRAKLAQARALRNAAQAQRNKAMNGARSEQVTAAYELWQQALVQEEVMKKSFDRMARLFEQKVVSEQKYDEVKAKYDAAKAQARAAESQYNMARSGARKEDKDAAAAVLGQADGALQEVNAYLDELFLTAPADGVVSAVFPKVGELVGTGSPVMTILDLGDLWFTFNIREDRLHGMRIGDRLTLSIPALDGRQLEAEVNYIAVRESYATWKATKENDMYDAKTFEVRAVPCEKVEGLLPGMTALVVE